MHGLIYCTMCSKQMYGSLCCVQFIGLYDLVYCMMYCVNVIVVRVTGSVVPYIVQCVKIVVLCYELCLRDDLYDTWLQNV